MAFSPLEDAWFHCEPHGTKGDTSVFICTKQIQNQSRNNWVMAITPWDVKWFYRETQWTKDNYLLFICTKMIKKRSKSGWVMTIFSLRGWVIPVRTIWVKRGSLCVHLYRKDPKLPQRGWVIPMRTTLDKSGSLGVNLYQNDPKSVKKWLSNCHFTTKRLGDSIENHLGQKVDPWVFICTKNIQNQSRNIRDMVLFP